MTINQESPALKVSRDLELTDEAFGAWWEHLASEDRDEFQHIYQGDEYLARFVCALDYLVLQKVEGDRESLIVLAYWIAAKRFEPDLQADSYTLRNRAVRAWQSDAVQALHDRVRYRSVEQGYVRLTSRLFKLGEEMADAAEGIDVPLKDKRYAADILVRIAQLVNTERAVIRSERTKRGLEKAREALSRSGQDDMTEREISVLVRMAASRLGTDKVLALMGEVESDGG